MSDEKPTLYRTPQSRLAFCNATIALKSKIESDFLTLGGRLAHIRDEHLYIDQWETFEDYVIEFKNISTSTASKLINIYRIFVEEYKMPVAKLVEAGGWTILAETLPHIKTKKDATEWLHKATTLTRTDLRRELMEAHTGIEQSKCKHANVAYLSVCLDCGLKERVNELPKDIIKKQL